MARPVFGNHVDSLMKQLNERRFERPVSIFATPEQQIQAAQEQQMIGRPQEDTAALTQHRARPQYKAQVDPMVAQRVRSENVLSGLSDPYLSQLEQGISVGTRATEAEKARTIWRKLDEQAKAAANAQQQTIYQNNGAPPLASGDIQLPLSKFSVTARYGQTGRMWKTTHGGIDLAAPTGTQIRPVQAGTVTKVENHPSFGNVVWVQHPNGLTTRYGHMSQFGNFRAGQQVGLGDVLGYVGQTGNASGPHLHLGYYDQAGNTLNPENYIGSLLRALGM